jgi:hypothetical protein
MRHTFKCGHESEEPRHAGRGQARVKRLAIYFDRPCLSCALAFSEKHIRVLTDMQGQPHTEYYYTVKVRERAETIRRTY